jgi:predicted CXXCH cytochrome family protein
VQARLAKAKFHHKVLETGCTSCHNPHASPLKYQLVADGATLCANCHSKVIESDATAAVKHSAVKQTRACLNCHDPHTAEDRPQLKANGVAVCLSCHDKQIMAGSAQLSDMRKLLAESQDHHGPIRDQNCAGCHQPHGSAHFRLLKSEYPKEFYAPFRAENFALCFGCHDASLPRDERTTTLTHFRNSDRNLHFVHVNKLNKGRTCRSCHETHASTAPNHIRKSVPFGSWELPINFTKTANGGSCAPGCHAPMTYDRSASP